jgi:hypothetical protein
MSDETISPLLERMIEDMTVRGIGAKTRHDYVQWFVWQPRRRCTA